jgi:hypothetical protein
LSLKALRPRAIPIPDHSRVADEPPHDENHNTAIFVRDPVRVVTISGSAHAGQPYHKQTAENGGINLWLRVAKPVQHALNDVCLLSPAFPPRRPASGSELSLHIPS